MRDGAARVAAMDPFRAQLSHTGQRAKVAAMLACTVKPQRLTVTRRAWRPPKRSLRATEQCSCEAPSACTTSSELLGQHCFRIVDLADVKGELLAPIAILEVPVGVTPRACLGIGAILQLQDAAGVLRRSTWMLWASHTHRQLRLPSRVLAPARSCWRSRRGP